MARTATAKRNPPARMPDGARPWDQIAGGDPEREYVYVNPNDELYGVSYYESIGYEVEHQREGGPRPRVGKTLGDGGVITCLGQVLMSAPKSTVDQIRKFGVGGGLGGQAYVDEIEKRILKPGGVDGLRGIGGYVDVINETERPQVER